MTLKGECEARNNGERGNDGEMGVADERERRQVAEIMGVLCEGKGILGSVWRCLGYVKESALFIRAGVILRKADMKKIFKFLAVIVLVAVIIGVTAKRTGVSESYLNTAAVEDVNAKFGIAAGSSGNFEAEEGSRTAEKEAAYFGTEFWRDVEVSDIKKLLEDNVDINAHNEAGVSLLMLAAGFCEKPEVLEFLIKNGARIERRNKFGRNALMYAAAFNPNYQIIKALIRAGANIEARDKEGKTALMFAAGVNGDAKASIVLLEAGAALSATDKRGWPAFYYAAAHNGNADVLRVFLRFGADVNMQLSTPQTEFSRASLQNRFVYTVKAGLNGAKIFTEEVFNQAKEKNVDIMGALEKSFDAITEKIVFLEEGMTPLMVAARDNASVEVLEVLLAGGANAALFDKTGKTAADYGAGNEHINQTDVYWRINDLRYQ